MTKRVTAIVILCAWLVLMLGAVVLSEATKTYSDSPYQDKMLEAAELAQKAFDEIKLYKQRHGIEFGKQDPNDQILQSGLMGKDFTYITTTEGVFESKRTSVNPNWAAVVVSMFARANLRPGDQVLMVFSGSFPALNICAIAAGQVYGLDMCLMGSVGASMYGATDEEFTFVDMVAYLCGLLDEKPTIYDGKEILFEKENMLDYVSLGGGDDCGDTFGSYMLFEDNIKETAKFYREKIAARIKDYPNVAYSEEPVFANNINHRENFVEETAPNVKFVLNVGGSMVGLGTGLRAHTQSGYVSPGVVVSNGAWVKQDKRDGLLQRYLQKGVPVASLLNVKGLADEYGIVYNPDERPAVDISQSNVYFTTKYNLVIPVVALAVTVAVAVLFCVLRVKNKIEVKQDERNHILCRR